MVIPTDASIAQLRARATAKERVAHAEVTSAMKAALHSDLGAFHRRMARVGVLAIEAADLLREALLAAKIKSESEKGA